MGAGRLDAGRDFGMGFFCGQTFELGRRASVWCLARKADANHERLAGQVPRLRRCQARAKAWASVSGNAWLGREVPAHEHAQWMLWIVAERAAPLVALFGVERQGFHLIGPSFEHELPAPSCVSS
jgi:hypothetical protein